jgi:hypothetical protein
VAQIRVFYFGCILALGFGAFFDLAGKASFIFLIGTFGVWLPYWTIFGTHSERPQE